MNDKAAPAKTPDILDIDAVSFATAVGHAAAARFAEVALPERIADSWWDGTTGTDIKNFDMEAAEKLLANLGGYICSRSERVAGETLYRKAVILRHVLGRWEDLGMVERNVWCLFAQTAWNVHGDMALMQRLERDRREAEAMQPSAAMPDEDDDEFAGLDTMDDEEDLGGKSRKKPAKKAGKPAKKK